MKKGTQYCSQTKKSPLFDYAKQNQKIFFFVFMNKRETKAKATTQQHPKGNYSLIVFKLYIHRFYYYYYFF